METMTCKEVESRLYPNRSLDRMGGKNIVSDLLYEVADSIGFKLNLLKQDFNPNKPFRFLESDYNAIEEFMRIAKTPYGKRLRCNDYKGATGPIIEQVTDFFLMLSEHNGNIQSTLFEQKLAIYLHTDFESVRFHIRQKTGAFEEDIEKNFFIIPYTSKDGATDDYISGMAQLIFLQFILRNPNLSRIHICGVYWFFKLQYEQKQAEKFHDIGKYIRSLLLEEREELRDRLVSEIKCDQAMAEDQDLQKKLDIWLNIEEGGGKLQDMRMQKKRGKEILNSINDYKEKMIKFPVSITDAPSVMNSPYPLSKQYHEAEELLTKAQREYNTYKAFRRKVPMTSDNESILEIEFYRRFGNLLFSESN